MKAFISTILGLLMLSTATHARTWTDLQGRKVEAEVVKVDPSKTVTLKTNRGKIISVPFGAFVAKDIAYLESLLGERNGGKEHAVSWSELNELFGVEIWQDSLLWDDSVAATAERMHLIKESKTDFMANYRAYPLGKEKMLGEPIYAVALYGNQTGTDSLSLIFLNFGDIPDESRFENVTDLIETTGKRMQACLERTLGEPKRDSLGKGDLREKVWRWDWNGHAVMLSIKESKYVALRIMSIERANHSGRIAKLSDDELKQRMASCVERRKNGDVIINNIPMINQGPKGYCSPATWERYLRYMGIPADMYLLALAANTGVGGGTYSQDMVDATRNIISSNGRKLARAGTNPSVRNVAKHIDKGLPILWRLMSTSSFQQTANNNTARRNGEKTDRVGSTEDSEPAGHICLIIGYNEKTDEIAISDSWGPRFAERWVPATAMKMTTMGNMNIIRW